MNLFNHRAASALPLPDEDGLDLQLQDMLQQAYTAETVSPALRQRVSDLAAYHEQQMMMHKPVRSRLRFLYALSSAAGVFCIAYLMVTHFLFGLYTIPSESMEPTLMGHDFGRAYNGMVHKEASHDHVLINKWGYRWHNPQFGDVVVFRAPQEADAEHRYTGMQVENILVKRIIGLPGDLIEIKGAYVYRNGKQLNEFHNPAWPYSIKEPMDINLEEQFRYGTRWRNHPLKLQEDEYWVMGDNRNDSNDSRYWGPLDDSRVIGKASIIFWPPSRIRMLH